MSSTWTCIHLCGCNWSISTSLLHFFLYWIIGINKMFRHSFHINSEGFMLSDFMALFWSLGYWDEQILHSFIVYFHHWYLDFVLLVAVLIFGDTIEDLLTRNRYNALHLPKNTLLAPYPTIEYDLPAPVWPYAKRQQWYPSHAFCKISRPTCSKTCRWSAYLSVSGLSDCIITRSSRFR